jgi:hypothetical protein
VRVRVLQSTASAKEKKSRKAAFVTFIDYGSVDSIPLEQLLPLDQVCAIINAYDNTLQQKYPNIRF